VSTRIGLFWSVPLIIVVHRLFGNVLQLLFEFLLNEFIYFAHTFLLGVHVRFGGLLLLLLCRLHNRLLECILHLLNVAHVRLNYFLFLSLFAFRLRHLLHVVNDCTEFQVCTRLNLHRVASLNRLCGLPDRFLLHWLGRLAWFLNKGLSLG
jgi:hypothetical protein